MPKENPLHHVYRFLPGEIQRRPSGLFRHLLSPPLVLEQFHHALSDCIGIARLNGMTCEGCHLQLSAVDVDRLRKEPSDALVRCTECSRLLVR